MRGSQVQPPWQRIGGYEAEWPDARLSDAALAVDGSRCLLRDWSGVFLLCRVPSGEVVWQEGEEDDALLSEPPLIEGWGRTRVVVRIPGAEGEYLAFGREQGASLTESTTTGEQVAVDVAAGLLILTDGATGAETARLRFAEQPGDWAIACFSEDGATLAVLEPYQVGFFRRQETP